MLEAGQEKVNKIVRQGVGCMPKMGDNRQAGEVGDAPESGGVWITCVTNVDLVACPRGCSERKRVWLGVGDKVAMCF